MRKLALLLSAALLVTPAYAGGDVLPEAPPPAETTAPPPPLPPGTYGYVLWSMTTCSPPEPHCWINAPLPFSGANLRRDPAGTATAALANGVPITVYNVSGDWLFVQVGCPMLPTGLWSQNVGVPLFDCGGHF